MSSIKEWPARRALFNQNNVNPEALKAGAAELVRADYLADAIDFLARAHDDDGLRQLLPLVVEEGNYFLFKMIANNLKTEYQPQADLQKLLKNAAQLGLQQYAEQARAHLEQF